METRKPMLRRHTRWLAMYVDATGLPRAYGVSPDKTEAAGIAKIELEAYREEHADRQEPFRLKFSRIA
jgi:hypothetical protein